MASEFLIESAVQTHPGRKRPQNEDFAAFFEPERPDELRRSGRLYLVADGVGGAARGERASQYAVEKVLYEYYNDSDPDVGARLKRAMRKAGNDIYDHVERSGQGTRMATTMVAAAVREGTLTVANVGDSRAYLIRAGRATQLTRDHTVAGELLRDGEIDEIEALNVKGKNRLMRSIGGERDVAVDIFPDIALESGDRIVLCTDGLARYALAEDIAKLGGEGDPEETVRRSVEYANERGGADNVSVAVVRVAELAPHARPTLRRRGRVPQPVDWDAMVTVPSRRPTRRRRRSRLRALALIAAVALLVLVAAALGVLWIARGPFPILSSPAGTLEGAVPAGETTPQTTVGRHGRPPEFLPTVAATMEPLGTEMPGASPAAELVPANFLSQLTNTPVLYVGDFSDVAVWGLVSGHQLTGGRLEARWDTPLLPSESPWWSYILGQEWSEFYVEVSATTGPCSAGDAYGVVVLYDAGQQPKDSGYALELTCDGYFRLLVFAPDQPPQTLVDRAFSDAIHAGEGVANRFGILVREDSLILTANSFLLGRAPRDRYPSGTVGLYSSPQGEQGLTVYFEGLTVWAVPAFED